MLYNINFDEPSIGYMQNVPANYMIHIRLLSKTGGMTGISPLSALADEMNIKDASNALTLKALKASISANGVLKITHGGLLDAKKKAARSRQFKQQTDLSDGGPIVIDDLEDYQPLEIRSNIAQLLSQTDWTSKQIAKVYGIPDSYLNGQGDQQSSITQIGGQYAKALNRYVQAILGELNNKLNVKISADIRTAIDAMGDQYATTISGLAKDNTIAPNQARFILQQSGYLPSDLPDAEKTAQPAIQINPNQREGGDSGNENN
jgi:HK97 family phage portal protein